MGKRRIRCLKTLGHNEIFGFDSRPDRVQESIDKYEINTCDNIEKFVSENKPIIIVSTPPDMHLMYMKIAVKYGCHFFVEASVLSDGLEEIIEKINENSIVGLPSCTMLFHPGIQLVKGFIEDGRLGNISNWIYHSGQYLPDWHTYEEVSDYYVSRKETSGGREIVPFELTWICKLFGLPLNVSSVFGKTIDFKGGDEVDDTYNLLVRQEGVFGSLVVDVVSRVATRRLLINGDKTQLRWDWSENKVKIFNLDTNKWDEYKYEKGPAEEGYNENISELPYVEEISSFINKTIDKQSPYPTDLEYDTSILNVLYRAEASCI